MDCKQIIYEFRNDDGDFDVEARLRGIVLGRAQGLSEGNVLLLADIRVPEEVFRPWPIMPRPLLILLGRCPPWRPRRHGIGTQLLTRFLREADAAGFREIYGSITQDDLDATPWILDWYQIHGFEVSEPDGQCVPTAVKKITRRKL